MGIQAISVARWVGKGEVHARYRKGAKMRSCVIKSDGAEKCTNCNDACPVLTVLNYDAFNETVLCVTCTVQLYYILQEEVDAVPEYRAEMEKRKWGQRN